MSDSSWIRAAAVVLPLAAVLAADLAACAPRSAPNADLARELTGFGEDQPARPNVSGSGNESRSGDH